MDIVTLIIGILIGIFLVTWYQTKTKEEEYEAEVEIKWISIGFEYNKRRESYGLEQIDWPEFKSNHNLASQLSIEAYQRNNESSKQAVQSDRKSSLELDAEIVGYSVVHLRRSIEDFNTFKENNKDWFNGEYIRYVNCI